MSFTREEAICLFREHWQWLAETGSYNKKEFIKQKGYMETD